MPYEPSTGVIGWVCRVLAVAVSWGVRGAGAGLALAVFGGLGWTGPIGNFLLGAGIVLLFIDFAFCVYDLLEKLISNISNSRITTLPEWLLVTPFVIGGLVGIVIHISTLPYTLLDVPFRFDSDIILGPIVGAMVFCVPGFFVGMFWREYAEEVRQEVVYKLECRAKQREKRERIDEVAKAMRNHAHEIDSRGTRQMSRQIEQDRDNEYARRFSERGNLGP